MKRRPPVEFVESRLDSYRRLEPMLRSRAVQALRALFTISDVDYIKPLIAKDPDEWIWEHHLLAGMGIRNALRDAGLKDDMLPPSVNDCDKGARNWDNHYVAVIEVALRAGIWEHLTPAEQAEVGK